MTKELPNGIRVIGVKVPYGTTKIEFPFLKSKVIFYHGKMCTHKNLPEGNWESLGRFKDIKEKQWRGIVDNIFGKAYRNYKLPDNHEGYGGPYTFFTATESARSLIGPGNPLVLISKK